MATRNQVLSLFGASPEQILERRRREDALSVLKQQDPFARAGGAIGLGLARMFGGEPAEVTRQRELFGKLEGVNFENPEQMRAAAATLSSQFPDKALQLITMADNMETSQQRRATAEAQQRSAEASALASKKQTEEVTRPYIVDVVQYKPLFLGGDPVRQVTQQVVQVKGTLNEQGKFEPYGGELNFGDDTEVINATEMTNQKPKVTWVGDNGVRLGSLNGKDWYTLNDEGFLIPGQPISKGSLGKGSLVTDEPEQKQEPKARRKNQVPPRPNDYGNTKREAEWDKKYGKTHDPDGNPKMEVDEGFGA